MQAIVSLLRKQTLMPFVACSTTSKAQVSFPTMASGDDIKLSPKKRHWQMHCAARIFHLSFLTFCVPRCFEHSNNHNAVQISSPSPSLVSTRMSQAAVSA
jgi:hypothetical protein